MPLICRMKGSIVMMKNKLLALGLALVLLLSLTACGATDIVGNSQPTTQGESSADAGEPSTENAPPTTATGTYNGKTVTLTLDIVTEIPYTSSGFLPTKFLNGYAPYSEEDQAVSYSNYIDRSGKRLLDSGYADVTHFSADGIAVVKKANGEWVKIDTTGQELAAATDEERISWQHLGVYSNYVCENGTHIDYSKNALVDKQSNILHAFNEDEQFNRLISENAMAVGLIGNLRLCNLSGETISQITFTNLSNCVNGVFGFVADGKLGIMADNGQVIIEPTFPVDVQFKDILYFSDNCFVLNQADKVAIYCLKWNNKQ